MKFQKIFTYSFVTLTLFTTSCMKDDTGELPFNSYVDAYILKTKVDEDTLYANSYSLGASHEVTSVSVKSPLGISQDLVKVANYVFVYDPELTDYTTEVPESGEYEFVFYRGNEKLTSTDVIAEDELDIPQLTKFELNDMQSQIDVAWESPSNTDIIQLRIYEVDTLLYYPLFGGSQESFSIDLVESGLYLRLEENEAYRLQLNAYLIEEGKEDSYQTNVQYNTYMDYGFTWGGDTIVMDEPIEIPE